MQWVNKM